MPAVAVVAAVVAVEAAVTVTTVFTVIAAVGAVTAAVGAVTGNQELIKIGSVVGLVGGIAGWASNALGAGEAAANSITASDAAANASSEAMLGDVAGQTADSLQAAGETLAQSAGDIALPDINMVANGAEQVASTVGQVAAPIASAAPTFAAPDTAGISDNLIAQTPTASAGQQISNQASASFTDASGVQQMTSSNQINSLLKPPTAFDDLMSAFKNGTSAISSFTKENPMLSSAILKGIEGAADPSQREMRDAQTANLNANAASTNQLTASRMGVGGLIDYNKVLNTNRPPTAAAGMIASAQKVGA